MFDRITEISENTGIYKKGLIKAELDIKDDLWFLIVILKEDPVIPGCLGLRCNVATSWIFSWLVRKSWQRKSFRSEYS